MTSQASISLVKNIYVATLGDGRRIKHSDLNKMAYALYCAGVRATTVKFEWHAGLRMITAGQQAALSAELSRLERDDHKPGLTVAA